MYCQNCGKQIPDGTKFCHYCGAQQGSVAGSDASQQQYTTQQQSASQQQYTTQQQSAPQQQYAQQQYTSQQQSAPQQQYTSQQQSAPQQQYTQQQYTTQQYPDPQQNLYSNARPAEEVDNSVSVGLVILAFIIPLFGIIYWPVKNKTRPRCARICGIVSIVSWIIGIVIAL